MGPDFDLGGITAQEVFDRAFRGLRTQGFMRAIDSGGSCVYHNPVTGRRCAWGHVDTEIGSFYGDVKRLREARVGIAGGLNGAGVSFARILQAVHDNNGQPERMEAALREFARAHHLIIPDEGARP